MSKYHLVLTFPTKSISRLKKLFSKNDSIQWLYLGKDFFKRRYMEHTLGSQFSRVDIARLHDEVARDIRQEHVQWIDALNRRYGKSLEWWFGSISSRDIYVNNLFQYCCYLEILERLWLEKTKMPSLVIVESAGLAITIKDWAAAKNINTEIIGHQYFLVLNRLKSYLRYLLQWNRFVIVLFLRWLAAQITRVIYASKDVKIKPSIIVDTFVHDYCILDNGVFNDRYFPYLHEYLSRKGMHVLVHPVLYGFRFNYYSIYKRMRKSNTVFIIQEDFLSLSNYFSALFYPLRVLFQKTEPLHFRNFNFYYLLKEELTKQPLESAMQSFLIYHLFLNFGKAGLSPEFIIDWYENQVIDKALIIGARRAFPNIKIIGAQLFIHSHNHLNLFPSESEVEAEVTPNLLLETSEYQCRIAQSFTKAVHCKPVAALRYRHLFSDDALTVSVFRQREKIILILLPFDISEAIEMLEIVKEGLDEIKDDIRILIKGHPDYDSKKVIDAFGRENWPPRYEIFNGNLSDALEHASVVISSNSSSMVEAAAKGIPVIFLGRQTVLNKNILSDLNMDIVTECFSSSELVPAIKKYIDVSSTYINEYRKMGEKVRDLFFTPINEKTMEPFLDNLNN